jgi:hypothetical protein
MKRATFAAVVLAAALGGCGSSSPTTPTKAGELHQPGPPVVTSKAHPAPVPAGAGSEGRDDGRVVAGGATCGRERWSVKTATDAAATNIVLAPKVTTIEALDALPSSNNGNPDEARTEAEQQTYTVTATLEAAKVEADSDIHLVLVDAGKTMIAEIPFAPACTEPPVTAGVSVLEAQIEAARNAFIREFGLPSSSHFTPINHKVTVTGVLFDDIIHGQRGVAPTGVELHPVIKIEDP